jgi:alanyl-tRNA synthetase
MQVVSRRFEEFGFPLVEDTNVIPNDDTTLFICSGMQSLKSRFSNPDGGTYGSLQSCIRTNDLELVGDGTHLTYFEMLGNFSFQGIEYQHTVEMWHKIHVDLALPVSAIHVHPTQAGHRQLWEKFGYKVVDDHECVWSDGAIGGYCCEVYVGGLEVGNLVNTLGHSTDVGYGWERLHMVLEDQERIDRTTLFEQNCHPVVADHTRAIRILRQNGIVPGARGREYVCRRLVRRVLPLLGGSEQFDFQDWLDDERLRRDRQLVQAKRCFRRHRNQPVSWWWDTFGILPEEVRQLDGNAT